MACSHIFDANRLPVIRWGPTPLLITGRAESVDRMDTLQRFDAYWRAANYLSGGQIYLLGNPLLAEPLREEHIKPR
jgi:XFP N-terminal domain